MPSVSAHTLSSGAPSALEAMQSFISSQAFADETESVQSLIEQLVPLEGQRFAIINRAEKMVAHMRKTGIGSGVEAFLHSYGLDTREGVAVMCLAEALLRIPDRHTANGLIRDKFESTEWKKYLGNSDSFFVNASSWGLLLTGSVVNLGLDAETPASLLGRMVARAGEPVIREALKQAMRYIGTQFVIGESIEEALGNSAVDIKRGYRFSYDILGEGARNQQQAEAYVDAYRHAISAIGRTATNVSLQEGPGISVKLSALHPRYSLLQNARVMDELLPRLKEILLLAKRSGIAVSIDAEEAARLDVELDLFKAVFTDPDFKHYDGIGFVLQAYQKRAIHVVDFLAALARVNGNRMMLRLVKGAYWDSEIKHAQIQGLPSYPVFTRKEHTDVSYLACAKRIIGNLDCFYPQFATHNALTIASIQEMLDGKQGAYEFQRLYGMGESLHAQLVDQGIPSRIYAPVGRHEDLLAYLIRRLLENGANTSFVNLLMDKEKPMSALLQDPVALAKAQDATQHPATPSPRHLYSDRTNSAGFDLGNKKMLAELQTEIGRHRARRWVAAPGVTGDPTVVRKKFAVKEPANHAVSVGEVTEAAEDDVTRAVDAAQNACVQWSATDVGYRATVMEKAASLFAGHRDEILALLTREAGKTLGDAIAEWREAIDFCHYYAAHARSLMGGEDVLEGPTGERNALRLVPRGVFACISPWNFPLAIFTGQIVAALVTGNAVIAKPAEQTPLIANIAVKLLHEAGVPPYALILLPGTGEIVGKALTSDERIAGVVFTGSMETARIINRSLAAREGFIAPLIAETGGQNCMIVDSSALLEQVTDDVVLSAFGSAGQRCSALRVLFVQEEVADRLIALIAGAMQELKIGDPLDSATDVGPVIDAEARDHLLAHIERMKKEGRLLAVAPLPPALANAGSFVAPHAFEIASLTQLPREVFGPVLHVIRYKASELESVYDAVNGTGYGLTFGLQSRIGDHVDLAIARTHAGNLYVNRSMTGATVGVQPFGGEGLSGTGPKAGGPHYLLRFVNERTVTINTAAIGGNLELLSKG